LIGKEAVTGWRYVIITRTATGDILGYLGPKQGASNDMSITNPSQLLQFLLADEEILADALWRHKPRFRTPMHPLAEYDERDLELRNWRGTIEHVIGRLKCFAVLEMPFRHHDACRHELVFRVLCKLFNHMQLEQPVQQVKKPGLIERP